MQWLSVSIVSVSFVVLATACSSSNIYDPSLTLPARPLHAREMQVQGALGALPQTRPDAVSSAYGYGGSGTARFAPAEWLTLQGRYWGATSGDGYGSGVSASALIRLDTATTGWRFVLVPSFGWTFVDNNAEGQGGSLTAGAWLPPLGDLRPYIGVGGAYGWNGDTYADDPRSRSGWGVLLNTGTHVMFTDAFSLVAEVTTVAQVNEFDTIAHLIFSPVIGVSYAW
jgi:hypothetical protein